MEPNETYYIIYYALNFFSARNLNIVTEKSLSQILDGLSWWISDYIVDNRITGITGVLALFTKRRFFLVCKISLKIVIIFLINKHSSSESDSSSNNTW